MLPNGQPANTNKARALSLADQVRVGLTGNLRDYRFTDATGKAVKGAEVNYNGAPTGYAASPARRSRTSARTTTRRCSTRSS